MTLMKRTRTNTKQLYLMNDLEEILESSMRSRKVRGV